MKFFVEIRSPECTNPVTEIAGIAPTPEQEHERILRDGIVFQGAIEMDPKALGALEAKLLAIRIPTIKPSVDLAITPVGSEQ